MGDDYNLVFIQPLQPKAVKTLYKPFFSQNVQDTRKASPSCSLSVRLVSNRSPDRRGPGLSALFLYEPTSRVRTGRDILSLPPS